MGWPTAFSKLYAAGSVTGGPFASGNWQKRGGLGSLVHQGCARCADARLHDFFRPLRKCVNASMNVVGNGRRAQRDTKIISSGLDDSTAR